MIRTLMFSAPKGPEMVAWTFAPRTSTASFGAYLAIAEVGILGPNSPYILQGRAKIHAL